MKHRTKSASPCDLKRQRLKDRLNRQAKPTSTDLTDELCTFSAAVGADSLPSLVRASAAVRRLTSLPSPGGEGEGEGVLSAGIHSTPDFPTRNQFPKLNLAAIFSLQPLARSISSPGGEDQGEGVRSLCSLEPVLQIKNHSIVNDKCPTTHFTTFQINKCNVQPLERTADSRYLQITKTPTYNFISHPDSAPRSLCRYVATSPCRSCLPQPSALALHLSRPPFGARTALYAGHIKSPKWQRCPAVGPQIP